MAALESIMKERGNEVTFVSYLGLVYEFPNVIVQAKKNVIQSFILKIA